MKTDVKGVLNQVEKAIESLKADTNDAEWTPQLGTAIGGLRAAKDGLEAHLQKAESGGRKTEGGGRKAESGGQKTEGGTDTNTDAH